MEDGPPAPRRPLARRPGLNAPTTIAHAEVSVAVPAVAPRSRLRRWLRALAVLGVCIFLCVFLGGEAYLRWAIGLGDPPLAMADPLMQYCYVPSQTAMRLHHLIHYNAYSMRSDDFPPHKTDPTELRIIMIGDSVINGGSMLDQSALVSSLLQKSLSEDLHRPVVVGNASAGGWGPPNELGWIKTYGTLDADVIVLVLSSHNYANVPHWPAPLGVAFDRPTRKPILAWEEFFRRYASRLAFSSPEAFVDPPQPSQSDISWCAWSIQQIVTIAHASGALVIVAQHAQAQELDGNWKPGHAYNEAAAKAAMADRIVQFEPTFRIARETGRDPYRRLDNIHPNMAGHDLMAEELRHSIENLLEAHPR